MNDAELMKHTRKLLRLNQSEMAARCGYSSKIRISEIENGKKSLSGPARKLLELLFERA